jgi:hypothetical protein
MFRMILPLVAALAVSLALSSSVAGARPTATAAEVCSTGSVTIPLEGGGFVYGGPTRTNGISCRTALRKLRRAKLTYGGRDVRLRGWACRLYGYYGDGGKYRCQRRGRSFRFNAGG